MVAILLPFFYRILKDKAIHHFRRIHNCRTMEKAAVLYGDEASPPVRFVLMTASILNVELDFHKIDLFKGENLTESYKKINPFQKVPSLVIGDTVMLDSHAIALYLCRMSGNQDMYPSEALHKTKVDQMLFFNACALFPVDSAIFCDYFAGKWPVEEQRVQKWYYLLDYLEELLAKGPWLTGNKMTLGDVCCAATVTSLQLLVPTLDRHQRVKVWLNKLQELPCFTINAKGIQRLKRYL